MREREGLHFGLISIINHWMVALLFIGTLCLGFYLDYVGAGRSLRGPWMEVHKATGVVLLVLATWRIIWRLTQGFPQDICEMPAWQRISAKMVHWILLIAIVAMPISGILLTLYGERSVNVFGLFTLPAQPENELISVIAGAIHEGLSYVFSGVIIMHVGAVIKHHVIDKDETLKRMLRRKKAEAVAAVTKKPVAAASGADNGRP